MIGLQWSKTPKFLVIVSGKVARVTTDFCGIASDKVVLFLHCAQVDSSTQCTDTLSEAITFFILSIKTST